MRPSVWVLAAAAPVLTTCHVAQGPRSVPSTASDAAPTVTLANGTYIGRHSTEYGQDFFLGLPFAQPPVGPLRYVAPQSLNTTFDEPRNATKYGPECIGYGFDQWILGNYISEDCLTLNVIRPEGYDDGDDLPVAVWIHGGSFVNGGGFDPRYNLSFIVEQSVKQGTPMIAVSIQYRLSNWGWLFSEELSAVGAGNLGLRDQRLALQWVQDNIHAFGGDAAKVTVWGESAGAFSVGYHLMAYGGRDDGLFRQAILESGSSSAVKLTNATQWQPYFDALVEEVQCNGTANVLDCLRELPWETLNAVFNSTVLSVSTPGIGAHIDGDIILEQGYTSLREGRFIKVPVLTGINTDEGASFATQGINTTEQFVAFVQGTGTDAATANATADVYPDIPDRGLPATLKGRPEAYPWGLQWKRMVAFYGDLIFHAGRRLMVEAYARAAVPVYSYRFNVLVNGNLAQQGSNHFKEVGFVFHNTKGDGYNQPGGLQNPFGGKGPEFFQLADLMSGMWVAFITSGDPNGYHSNFTRSSCSKWPVYTLDSPRNIVFDVNVTNLHHQEPDNFRRHEIEFVNDHWRL
ncbi:lipase 2 [Pestalotiopsis sp. NC0098]|nr:lipase 2 [Pestalotiopsis sp. NC0098]